MNAFNSASLQELLENKEKPCVSLYLPAAVKAADTIQPPIRLKNLLARAWAEMVRKYPDAQKPMSKVFQEAGVLVDNKIFWLHEKIGFALFMAPGVFRHYSVYIPLKDRWTVGSAFNIKPLLPLFTDKTRYYLLALSQKLVRLYEISDGRINERELPNVIQSIEELAKYEVREKQLQLYAMPTGGFGHRSGVAHGHATDIDGKEMKKRVSEFVKTVISGIEQYLQADHTPVLLCAEPFMQHLVTDSNPSFNLMKESVSVNPTRLEPEQILPKASQIMDREIAMQTKRTLDRLAALMDTGWTIQNVEQIIPRAEEGRIDILFIDPDESVWGYWNRDGGLIQVHEQPAENDQDLSDIAVLQTLLHGGQVYAVPRGAIEGGSPMAAILRY